MSTAVVTPADAGKSASRKSTKQPEAAPRRSLLTWLRQYRPDPRFLHPYIAVSWLWAVAWIPVLFGLSPWWMLPAGLASTAVACWVARRTAPARLYGDVHPRQIGVLVAVAGVAATIWLVWAGFAGPLHPPVMGVLLIAGLVKGALYAGWRSVAPARRAKVAHAEVMAAEVELRTEWTQILTNSGIKGMRVIGRDENRAGYTLTLEHQGTNQVTIDTIKTSTRAIAAAASRALADTGVVIGSRGIRVEETEHAHRFLLHVTTIDVLKSAIPYVPRRRPASITDPIDVGLYEVGDPVELMMWATNSKTVGASRKGKSVLLNVQIARLLECDDVLLWVGGTLKLVPLVYPWLLPWITGRTRRPALDYVAGDDIRQVLMMLADAYYVGKERAGLLTTESKLIPSPRLPAIVVLLDEASDSLNRSDTIEVDGRQMTASELVSGIAQIGGAVNITVHILTQFGLYDAIGGWGPEIHRNLQLRIALQTLSDSDGRNTLVGMDNVDTTKLKYKSMLIQPDVDEPRALPAKAYHLEGATMIAPLAEQYTAHMAYLDRFTFDKLPYYATRWSADRIGTLTAVIQAEGHPLPDLAATTRACQGDDQGTINARFTEIVEGISVDADQQSSPAQAQFSDSGKPLTAGIDQFEAEMKRINEQMGAVQRIADPLKTVAEALTAPNAPKGDEFLPTSQLAFVIDRVAADASDDEVAKAATTLGRDINRQCPALRSIQVTVDGKQVRGYRVNRLWDAIHFVAYGKPMPADDTDDSTE